MKNRQLLIPILLLNVLVSAVTVFLVLYLWEQAHPAPYAAQATAVAEETTLNTPESNPPEIATTGAVPIGVGIEAVFGVGSLDLEYVLIHNDGDAALNLSGWRLEGTNGSAYSFPNLNLNRNGAVKLYSKAGTDSVIELFWNATQARWRSGDSVWLVDPNGNAYPATLIP